MLQPSRFPPHPGQLPRLSPQHQTNRKGGRGVKWGAHRWAGVPKDQPTLCSPSAPSEAGPQSSPSVTEENTDPIESATSK